MKNLTAFQKQQVSDMTDIDRETLDKVLEAIAYVKAKTPAFTGPAGGPHSATQWTETRSSGRDRTANMRGGLRKAGTVINLKP